LAALYLIAATFLFFEAMTCTDGFFCGIAAIPVFAPAGFLYSRILSSYVSSPAILQWEVIIPAVLTNTVLYYFLGYAVDAAFRKLFKR
jgi:hypothetical protein